MDELKDVGQESACSAEETADREPSDDKTAGEATPGGLDTPDVGDDGSVDREPVDDKTAGEATPAGLVEVTPDELLGTQGEAEHDAEEVRLLAVMEAIVYVTDEPLAVSQIANAMGLAVERAEKLLETLVEEYNKPHH